MSRKQHRDGDGAITRTRDYFQFVPAPGLLMLDYDPLPGVAALPADELRTLLVEAAPCLAAAPMLWRPSVSSGICAPDGRELTGLRGQRIYIPVADASLTPKAGEALVSLLWAVGQGHAIVGTAGQTLLRTLVDATVFQPERLDFAAPPLLADGLTRRPAQARIWGETAGRFDLRKLIAQADSSR